MSYTALLILQDGTVFKGNAIGKIGTSGGEICFNTGMTGYQEIYTDPSYYGQIIVNTTPHIGNYGVIDEETESDAPKIAGIVINAFSEVHSRVDATASLQKYLEQHGVVGISGIDTRRLVRHIRSVGAMNAIISSEILDEAVLKEKLRDVPDMAGLELSSIVTTKQAYDVGDPNSDIKVACMDFGIKKNILRSLTERGVFCRVFPARTTFDEVKQWNPDAYFLSNGPGDPATMDYAIETTKQMLASDKPLFGICLGHQLLARANGIGTSKMHHGHRGLNHPVKNMLTGLGEITSQNHGFEVNREEVEKSDLVDLTHIHLNDGTVAGIRLKNGKAFSVQYHPESSPGPHDSRYLFDDFINLIKNKNL
ncbi:glutamine-hydrolyzing carbamoyl-phosphate synthase small subunit [Penaeicola halotolerans]|uniref:glutamine-hydrolyzing carbamoyl-phosphate synthase small subunit n=1 Tax=Penaeicola halotolerans TaxID=2793196 RepID=UPI001CF7EE2B|nr:glutamine-hydrolyzing carbamoyl-phosphate synthase small subunit [Penaeicola halotolerans]